MMIYPILALLFVTFTNANFQFCTGISKCKCESYGTDAHLTCPHDGEINLQVDVSMKKKTLQISCNHLAFSQTKSLDSSIFDDLLELSVKGIDDLSFQFCPLPKESFMSFAQQLNVIKLKKLRFEYSRNEIGTLSPPYLDSLSFLEELNLIQNSNLTGLHIDSLKGMPNLKNLFLRGNAIKELYPGVFQNIPKLEVLDLGNNEISHLDSGIFRNLISLRILNIDSNYLVNLSRPLFNSVPNLEALDISGNRIVELPLGVFADLMNVRTLQANKNVFKTLPSDLLTNMKHLQVVKIVYHNYSLMALPSKLFANLPELTNVTLRESSVQSLSPDLFWNSPKLYMISFTGHKKITSLPRDLFRDCKVLWRLELNDNRLDDLPEELFASLSNLKELTLSKNNFESIKKSMFDGLSRLSRLDMSHNSLKYIDMFAFNALTNLKYLDLSFNALKLNTDLSYSPMKQCLKLEQLILSNNRINEIYFDWLTGMTQLKLLDLRRNNFTSLADVFGSIISDKLLVDLSDNKISVVHLDSLEIIGASQSEHRDKVPKVILNENPIACNCSNYDLIRYINMSMHSGVYNLVEFDTNKLKCASTGDFFNKIVPAQVACVTNNCPTRCFCTYWPYNSSITVDCSSAQLRSLPQPLPNKTDNEKKVKSIYLILKNNLIENLPENITENYKLVTQLDLSNNKITQIKAYSYFLQLKRLDLSSNRLQSLDDAFIGYLSNGNLNSKSINLSNNSWVCNCSISNLHSFLLNKHDRVDNSEGVLCEGFTAPLNTIPIDEFCTTYTATLISASIALGVIGFLMGVLMAVYYKFRQEIKAWMFEHPLLRCLVTEEELDMDKTYDAFVSYAKEDDPFVLQTLIPGLEKNNFKITHHLKDFLPGEWIHSQIIRSVQESRRTIIVLSKDFLKSYWGTLEFRTAYAQAIRENRARVIILIYGDVPSSEELDSDLKEYMALNTYIKWGDPWFWKKLNYVLPHSPSKLSAQVKTEDSTKLMMDELTTNNDKDMKSKLRAELMQKA